MMPKPFSATIEKPTVAQPESTPESFGSGVGATIAKQADLIETAKEEGETRTALVATAQIRAKYAKALDDAQTSGAPVQPLQDKMNEELGKVGEGFSTNKGAAEMAIHTARTNELFQEQVNRVEVTRAAAQARLQGMEFLNSESATIASNPAYLASSLQNVDALVSTFTNVAPEKRALIAQELKNQLNAAAAMTSSRIDPEATKVKLENGAWDLTPEQRRLAISQADTAIRAKRVDEDHQRALRQQDIHDRNEAASLALTKGIIAGGVRDKDILNNPDLTSETSRTLIGFMAARAREVNGENKLEDQVAKRRLWLSINAADEDQSKIYSSKPVLDAVNAGQISTTTGDKFMTMLANSKDENNRSVGMKMRTLSVNFERALAADPRTLAFTAPQRAEIVNDYTSRVFDAVAEARSEGKGKLNTLFDAKSKDFVGSVDFTQQSIDAAMAKQREAIDAKHAVTKTPQDALAVKDGATFTDPNGIRRLMTPEFRIKLKASMSASPAATIAVPVTDGSQYIQAATGRRGGFEINTPQRSQFKSLDGKHFATREEAEAAVAAMRGKP
jgi:hypothetical protein